MCIKHGYSTYLLLSLVKGAMEYLDSGVMAQEKGEKNRKGRWAGSEGDRRA